MPLVSVQHDASAEYEIYRILGTRSLFEDIRWNNFISLTPQQRILCDYIICYITYQKRIVCKSIFKGMAKSSCISFMNQYIKNAEKNPGKRLVQHLRSDSLLILNGMKRYGAESREYDMLGEIFVALLRKDVLPLDFFSQRKVNVEFWLDVETPTAREGRELRVRNGLAKKSSELSDSTHQNAGNSASPNSIKASANGKEGGLEKRYNDSTVYGESQGDELSMFGFGSEGLTRPLL